MVEIVNLFFVIVEDYWGLAFQFLEEIPLAAFHFLIGRNFVMQTTVKPRQYFCLIKLSSFNSFANSKPWQICAVPFEMSTTNFYFTSAPT